MENKDEILKIASELSYYPLGVPNYSEIIKNIIERFPKKNLHVYFTPVSTLIQGNVEDVMNVTSFITKETFSRYTSILEVKYTNGCVSDDFFKEK